MSLPSPRAVLKGKARLAGASLIAMALCATTGAARAQDAQASQSAQAPATQAPATQAPAQAPAKTTGGAQGEAQANPDVVTITADKPEVTHKADRDVYDVKQDPTSSTGSAADVLNNVPSVTVDPDGTVGLRGNSNVQVYVNGKKSPQMSGDNRGFTLQSMSGDDIDSVEVITNPTAEFGADSAGGIINIVLKRGRAIKPQTSINAVVGDQGRGMVSFNTGKQFGSKLTLNTRLTVNHGNGGDGSGGGGRMGRGGGFGPKSKGYDDRVRLDPLTGAVLREDKTNSVSKSDNSNLSGNVNGIYNLSDSDQLEGNFDYSRNQRLGHNASEIVSYDGSGTLIGDRASLRDSYNNGENLSLALGFDHRGQIGSAEDFKMQVTHSQALRDTGSDTHNVNHYPATGDTYSAQAGKFKDFVDEFSGDWVHPFGETDKSSHQIKMGWDLQKTVSDQYNYRSLTLPTPVQSPESPRASAVTQFDVDQILSAAYFIYEQKTGKIGFQVGLRVEDMHQKLMSATPLTGTAAATATYDNLFYAPNFIVTYDITEQQRLNFSYSRKLQRPSGNQLNPLVIVSDDGLTARSGNANLKPEQTDKYELRYNRDNRAGINFNASVYYNATTGSINQVTTFLTSSPDVLLTTYQNSGSRQQTGADFGINGQTQDKKFRYNLNTSYNYTVSNGIDLATGLPIHTKGPYSLVQGRLTYRPTTVDTITVGGNYSGKQTQLQSYTTGVARLNLSYSHQFIPNKFVLTVNASNFLVGPTSKRYTNSSTVRDVGYTFNSGASFMASLRYTFGQVRNGNNGDRGNWRGGQGGGRGGQGGPGGYGGPGGGGAGGPPGGSF
ncbi:TonB-dependent receptor [Asticcacaulis solisilvae]|uniref:TonB-dependent receptor n=1 Tax=Asticcacaulis solisilvae TaxID=1217274 RepID=UPI003FD777E4